MLPFLGAILIAAIAPGAMALTQHPPVAGQPMVVITAPWGNAIDVAARADGRFIAPGHIASVALVASSNPEFTDLLYGSGAWMVLNADLAGLLCKIEDNNG
ncbi:MAG: hypothetical protein AAGJ28_17910 [Pseudomonadota bacterium]